MKGATIDLGMFEILVKACRRLADKEMTYEQHDSIAHILVRAIDNLCSTQTQKPRHERSDYSKWDARNHHPLWTRRDNVQKIIKRARFDQAECGVMFAAMIENGNDLLDLYDTYRIDRAIRTLADMKYGDDCIEELETSDVIRQCDDCGAYEWANEITYPDEYEGVCRSCMNNNYAWSDYEDRYIHNDYVRHALDQDGNSVIVSEDNDDFVWSDDEDMYVHCDYVGESRILRGYHSSKSYHRPIHSEWTKRNGPFYMGCELEVEVKKGNTADKVEQLHTVLNKGLEVGERVFFEEDGSLSYGFEIITQPMGLDLHEEFWQWTNDAQLRRNMVSHNTSTCGFHVHLSKRPLTQLQINKMITFVNHPDNESLIRAIARRYAQNYARIKAKKLGNAHKTDDRYEAINITNPETIEFRIFRGSLKYETLMAAIEFVNALRNFTAPASPVGFDLSQDKFLQFIHEGAVYQETKHLRPYIETRLERN